MFRNPIRKALKAKGLTVVALAKASRISRSYIYRIINGKYPSVELMKRIARILGLSNEEIFPLMLRLKVKINEKLIRELMIHTGYAQNELARMIGIAASTLSNILACRREIGEKTLSGLKRLYPALIM